MAHFHQHHEEHSDHNHVHFNSAFKIGIALNLAYVIIEIGYGTLVDSLALISDGIHNLTDVFGLAMSWIAFYLAARKPAKNFTYGYGRATILAAFLNACFLMLAVGIIGWEAFEHLKHPQPIPGGTVMIVSGIGIIVNVLAAMVFFRDRHSDINVSGAFLHMAGDAVISLGVLLSGLVIYLTGWTPIDPIMSLIVLAIVIYSTWTLMSKSLRQLLDSVPHNININEVREIIQKLPEIVGFHDLHVWNLTSNQTAITVHLTIKEGTDSNHVLSHVNHELEHHFGIKHSTIQIEVGDEDDVCGQECLH